MFLGEDLLPLLVLALGAALAVGHGVALLRPPPAADDGNLSKAPLSRSVTMIVLGLVAAVWAVATLTS
ncbi:MAG: hypothetical protein KY454_05875 [Actinobacteria bacterium]|nr:hypothetical protein [Actinomycetota bacterium]MBW3650971.1 hypothetical protein [Actinomycetota bacterium]